MFQFNNISLGISNRLSNKRKLSRFIPVSYTHLKKGDADEAERLANLHIMHVMENLHIEIED